MMKTLILMRHSHAASNNPSLSDHDRPLTQKGKELLEPTSAELSRWKIDQVICSSAVRTVETAQQMSIGKLPDSSINVSKDLYLASSDSYPRVAAELADRKSEVLLMVGHNPGIASLIWSWGAEGISVSPGTAVVFQIGIDEWSELAGSVPVTTRVVAMVSEGRQIPL